MRRAKDKTKKKKRVIPTPRRIGGGANPTKLSVKAKQLLTTLPRHRLSNFDLIRLARSKKVPNFRGVFMIDESPSRPWTNERAIFNLDKSNSGGTHWICYKKKDKYVKFFDSRGVGPPSQLVRYLKGCRISSNRKQYQKVGTHNCGQLCLLHLLDFI